MSNNNGPYEMGDPRHLEALRRMRGRRPPSPRINMTENLRRNFRKRKMGNRNIENRGSPPPSKRQRLHSPRKQLTKLNVDKIMKNFWKAHPEYSRIQPESFNNIMKNFWKAHPKYLREVRAEINKRKTESNRRRANARANVERRLAELNANAYNQLVRHSGAGGILSRIGNERSRVIGRTITELHAPSSIILSSRNRPRAINILGSRPNVFQRSLGIVNSQMKRNVITELNKMYMNMNNHNTNKRNYIRRKTNAGNGGLSNRAIIEFQKRLMNKHQKYVNFFTHFKSWKNNVTNDSKLRVALNHLNKLERLAERYSNFHTELKAMIRNKGITRNHPLLTRHSIDPQKPLSSFNTFNSYKNWVKKIMQAIHSQRRS